MDFKNANVETLSSSRKSREPLLLPGLPACPHPLPVLRRLVLLGPISISLGREAHWWVGSEESSK